MPRNYAGTQDQQMARGEKRKFCSLQVIGESKVRYLQLTTHFLLTGREIIVGGVADLTVGWSYRPDGV
jgi:hypothetical protein